MGRGRAPCCDRNQVKRGPWSPAEDLRLITFIQKHGHDNWRALPRQAGLLRCGKSCRLRWINYLRPDVKRGNFSREEEETIISLHHSLGNKWSMIASHLPGRTDNEIKNVWNTHLKKRLSRASNGNHKKKCYLDNNLEPHEDRKSSLASPSSSSSLMFCNEQYLGSNLGTDVQQPVFDKQAQANKCQLTESSQIINPFNDQLLKGESASSPSSSISLDTPPKDPSNLFEEELEIPFEFDLDFWEMLDSLAWVNNSSSGVEGDRDAMVKMNNNVKEDEDRRQWFKYIENELGMADADLSMPNYFFQDAAYACPYECKMQPINQLIS